MRLTKEPCIHVKGTKLDGFINEDIRFKAMEPGKSHIDGMCAKQIRALIQELEDLADTMETMEKEINGK